MKSKKTILIEEDEEEEDKEFMEEQSRMLEAQNQKELAEKNKFDTLCDGVMNGFALLQSSFSEMLDLKDELLQHDLPPSLLVSMVLTVGKMFRTITDLDTPVSELTRLVNVFSIPWQKRSEGLKKLHADYENKKRELDIALRRLKIMEKKSERFNEEKTMMNWEKLFTKMTMGTTEGRKWKFHAKDIKRQLNQGVSLSQLKAQAAAQRDEIGNQTFKMESSHERKVDDYSIPGINDIENLLYQSPSPDSELYDLVSDEGEFDSDEEEPMPTIQKPPCEDKSVWTGDVEEERKLAVRIYHSPQLAGVKTNNDEITCTVSFGKQHLTTPIFPQNDDTKSLGLKSRMSPKLRGSLSSPTGSKFPPISSRSPSRSKRKTRFSDENLINEFMPTQKVAREEKVKFNLFHELIVDVEEQQLNDLNITINNKNKFVGSTRMDWNDLQAKNLAEIVKNELANENKEEFEEELKGKDILNLPVEMSVGNTADEFSIESLPLTLYWIKERKSNTCDTSCNTQGIEEIVQDLTGIDMNEMSKEKIRHLLESDKMDISTSPILIPPSPTQLIQEQALISEEEMETIKKQHDVEIQTIQEEYEDKLKNILSEMEELRNKAISNQQQHKPGNVVESKPGINEETKEREITTPPPSPEKTSGDLSNPAQVVMLKGENSKLSTPPQQSNNNNNRSTTPLQWGLNHPQDVWERMRVLTDEMIKKRQNVDMKIRKEIAANIEKKLASQYKLQRGEVITGSQGRNDVILPALFMPTTRVKNIFSSRARMHFHDGSSNPRLTQPPSIFQLPPLSEKSAPQKIPTTVNLYDMSKSRKAPSAPVNWLERIATATSRGVSKRAVHTTPNVSRLSD